MTEVARMEASPLAGAVAGLQAGPYRGRQFLIRFAAGGASPAPRPRSGATGQARRRRARR
jgi:hypothetical protein